jgi:hypothetical protein
MPPRKHEATNEVDEQVRESIDLLDCFSFVYMFHAATCCVSSIAKTLLCCCTATTGVDKRDCEYLYPSLLFRFIDQSYPAALRARELSGLITDIDDSIKSLRDSIPYIGPAVDVLIDVVKTLDVSV